MSDVETAVRAEIEDLHAFFVDWFAGRAAKSDLETRFAAAMDPELVFVSPDGRRLGRADLIGLFEGGHGANPDFRIAVRDVRVLRETGGLALATYTEWQRRAANSARPENGRFTTVLMARAAPFRWLHLHETWLPEQEQDAADYDF